MVKPGRRRRRRRRRSRKIDGETEKCCE